MAAEHSGAYNDVLYPSYLARQCCPDQMSVMARLKGLETAPPDRCRVLELGCGDGASLIAFGYASPDSEFMGVDLAARPVENGNARIAALGLANVTLRAADVMDVDASYGQFDFIFAHGLFSWVPEPVREGILEICRERLAPNGVAYLSYNAYPGGYQRMMLREMLLIHTRHVAEPAEKIRQTVGLMNFIRAAPIQESPYHQYIETIHQSRGKVPLEAMLYDELGSVNQQFFFHEFAGLAARHGLQFVSEATFDQTVPLLSPELRKSLNAIGGDVVTFEQYLDFLLGRSFRQTLLCHREVTLDRRRRLEPLANLYFASPVKALVGKETDRPGLRRFAGLHGRTAAASDPGAQRALEHLGAVWPAIVPYSELAGVSGGDDAEVLGEHLLQLAQSNFLDLHSQPFRLCRNISAKPFASALARHQIGERFQANLFCEAVLVKDPLGSQVLARLDGTRTREALAAELGGSSEAVEQQVREIFELGLLEA